LTREERILSRFSDSRQSTLLFGHIPDSETLPQRSSQLLPGSRRSTAPKDDGLSPILPRLAPILCRPASILRDTVPILSPGSSIPDPGSPILRSGSAIPGNPALILSSGSPILHTMSLILDGRSRVRNIPLHIVGEVARVAADVRRRTLHHRLTLLHLVTSVATAMEIRRDGNRGSKLKSFPSKQRERLKPKLQSLANMLRSSNNPCPTEPQRGSPPPSRELAVPMPAPKTPRNRENSKTILRTTAGNTRKTRDSHTIHERYDFSIMMD
jgi:hypothetical protein